MKTRRVAFARPPRRAATPHGFSSEQAVTDLTERNFRHCLLRNCIEKMADYASGFLEPSDYFRLLEGSVSARSSGRAAGSYVRRDHSLLLNVQIMRSLNFRPRSEFQSSSHRSRGIDSLKTNELYESTDAFVRRRSFVSCKTTPLEKCFPLRNLGACCALS